MSKATGVPQPGSNASNPPVTDDDTLNPKISVSCLDFLLIELVPLAQRITERLHARDQALRNEFQRSKILQKQMPSTDDPSTHVSDGSRIDTSDGHVIKDNISMTGTATDTTTTVVTAPATIPGTDIPSDLGPTPLMNDETHEAVFWRLDNLGYRVGQGLVER